MSEFSIPKAISQVVLPALAILYTNLSFSQKATIISPVGGTIKLVSFIPNPIFPGVLHGKVDTTYLGKDSAICKLNAEELCFYIQKAGYKSQTQILKRKDILDNKKRMRLSPLQEFPKKTGAERYIRIEKVAFNVKAKDYFKKYYEDYESYLKQITDHTGFGDKELIYENTIFEDHLENCLLKGGYTDTTNKISFNKTNTIKMELSVNSITQFEVGVYTFIELKTKVKILNPFEGMPAYETEFSSRSNAFILTGDEKNAFKMMVEDAMETLFLVMPKDEAVQGSFKKTAGQVEEDMKAWKEIAISNSGKTAGLESAVESVVTVLKKSGHGSGCLISQNGYILTNYHVAGMDTLGAEVLFGNGVKKKCRLVRSNPLYDLALLKVDTTIASVLKINFTLHKVGAEVYAIGTPNDIELGQSVTKGIISGKRKIEERLYIQSDVSVNGGNSGGAMTNKEGELIGIVNAKLVGVGIEGVSFAIPVSDIETALKIKIVQ